MHRILTPTFDRRRFQLWLKSLSSPGAKRDNDAVRSGRDRPWFRRSVLQFGAATRSQAAWRLTPAATLREATVVHSPPSRNASTNDRRRVAHHADRQIWRVFQVVGDSAN